MITITDLKRLLMIENELIHQQTKDLTDADTFIQPQPSGNCMHWVLGHLLDTQVTMLETLGGHSPIARDSLQRYTRESEPIREPEIGLFTLVDLLDGHDQVHQAVKARLSEMGEDDFNVDVPFGQKTASRGWAVFFLHFHYSYHIGQLELLRQLAGKLDKVV